MKRPIRHAPFLICAIIATLALSSLAQLTPNAPIENFKFPVFSPEGWREWHLSGEQAIYGEQGDVQVSNMLLRQFAGDSSNKPISSLKTLDATFLMEAKTAYGPGAIEVTGEEFRITGQDWIWQGTENRITINKSVKVVLFGEIGNLIK